MKTYEKTASIEDTLLGLAYEATGIFFPKTERRIHPLVPENLRELQQILAFFDDLIGEPDKERSLQRFREFLMEYWIVNNLPKCHEQKLRELEKTNVWEKNRLIVRYYYKLLDSIPGIDLEPYLKEGPFDPDSRYFHISLGDVIACFDLLEKYQPQDETYFLNFAFSVLLTLDMQHAFVAEIPERVQRIINGRIYNNLVHYGYPEREIDSRVVQKIIGFSKVPFSGEENITLRSYGEKIQAGSVETEPFQYFEFLHLFLFMQDTRLDQEYSFRQEKSSYYEKKARYDSNVGKVNVAFLDIWAWMYYAANPVSNLTRLASGQRVKEIVESSLFYSKEYKKVVCPFPFLYNVFLIKEIVLESQQGLETFFKNSQGNEEPSDLIKWVFNQLSVLRDNLFNNGFLHLNDPIKEKVEDTFDRLLESKLALMAKQKEMVGDNKERSKVDGLINSLFISEEKKNSSENYDTDRPKPISDMGKNLFDRLRWQNNYFRKIRQNPHSRIYTPRRHANGFHNQFMEYFEPDEELRFDSAFANIKVDEHKPSFRTEIGNVIYDISNRLIKEYRDYQKQITSL